MVVGPWALTCIRFTGSEAWCWCQQPAASSASCRGWPCSGLEMWLVGWTGESTAQKLGEAGSAAVWQRPCIR